MCKVKYIKKDMKDLTLNINNGLLNLLAGDYDGDVLNLIALMEDWYVDEFGIFQPHCMTIDRNNGNFNRDVGLSRDRVAGIANLLL